MDSLGGTSKALMIACVSPSAVYAEETFSTLSYASRAMNIKNKPVIQMDQKEQIIYNLKREIQLLRLENDFLKDTVYQLNGGAPIEMPKNMQTYQPKSDSLALASPKPDQPFTERSGPAMLGEYDSELSRLRAEN